MSTKAQRRKWQRNWETKHPERHAAYRERSLESIKQKYRDDPEWREKKKAYASRYARENREEINKRRKNSAKQQATQRRYNTTEKRRLYIRERWLRMKYGITIADFDAMLASQNGGCAICGKPETHPDKWATSELRLRVDHDHATRQVRGLLCHHCNAGLGHLKDDPALLRRAIKYLERRLRKAA